MQRDSIGVKHKQNNQEIIDLFRAVEGNNAYIATDAFVSDKNIDYQALDRMARLKANTEVT